MTNFDAILYIYPNAKFSIVGDDVSTIIWHETEYPIPTQEEIDAAMIEIELEKQNSILALNSALIKLQALGLTLEEAKAIGGIK